uniref:Putative secreted protein n=1 Tax=Rhipicephalus microplus TaxID=6941 RepID=A0A6M2DEH6_RHIMP
MWLFLICIVFVVYVCSTQGQIRTALFVQHSLLLMGRPGYCSEQHNLNTLTIGKCWYDTLGKCAIVMNTFT